VQAVAGARVFPTHCGGVELFVRLKSAEFPPAIPKEIALMVTAVLLVRVTVCGALFVFSGTLPKEIRVGVTVNWPEGGGGGVTLPGPIAVQVPETGKMKVNEIVYGVLLLRLGLRPKRATPF
jgi:hypothetical protein